MSEHTLSLTLKLDSKTQQFVNLEDFQGMVEWIKQSIGGSPGQLVVDCLVACKDCPDVDLNATLMIGKTQVQTAFRNGEFDSLLLRHLKSTIQTSFGLHEFHLEEKARTGSYTTAYGHPN